MNSDYVKTSRTNGKVPLCSINEEVSDYKGRNYPGNYTYNRNYDWVFRKGGTLNKK